MSRPEATNPLGISDALAHEVAWCEHPRPHYYHCLWVQGCAQAREQGTLCPGCLRNGFTSGQVYAAPPWRCYPARVRVRIQRLRCREGGERHDDHPRFLRDWRMDRELFHWVSRAVLARPLAEIALDTGVDPAKLRRLRDGMLNRLGTQAGPWHVY